MLIIRFIIVLLILIVAFVVYNIYKHIKYEVIPDDEMYLINLDRRKDRLVVTKKNLELYGYNKIKRYSAIDSSKYTAQRINDLTHPDARDSIFKNYRTHDEQLSRGALGCYLSHLDLWKQMIDKNVDKIVVFEDDTYPTITSDKLQEYIRKIPNDWDIILFGGWYKNGWRIDKNIYKIQRYFGMHGYMIRNTNNVRDMVRNAMPIRKQIDWYLTDLATANKINIYGIMHSPMWTQNTEVHSTDVQIPIIK